MLLFKVALHLWCALIVVRSSPLSGSFEQLGRAAADHLEEVSTDVPADVSTDVLTQLRLVTGSASPGKSTEVIDRQARAVPSWYLPQDVGHHLSTDLTLGPSTHSAEPWFQDLPGSSRGTPRAPSADANAQINPLPPALQVADEEDGKRIDQDFSNLRQDPAYPGSMLFPKQIVCIRAPWLHDIYNNIIERLPRRSDVQTGELELSEVDRQKIEARSLLKFGKKNEIYKMTILANQWGSTTRRELILRYHTSVSLSEKAVWNVVSFWGTAGDGNFFALLGVYRTSQSYFDNFVKLEGVRRYYLHVDRTRTLAYPAQ